MSLFSSFGSYLFGVPQSSSAPYDAQAAAAQAAAQRYAGREQSDYNNQAALADSLWRTANGTAPSVADMQLQQSFGENLNNGLAAGSGATGTNAVLARYLASQATGNNGAQLAQAAGIQRAKETQAAQQQLGGLYGNMDSASSGLYGTNLNTGLGYSNLANSVNQANSGRAQQSEAAGLSALGGLGSMYFSGRGGSAVSPAAVTGGGDAFAPGGVYGGGGLSKSDSADFAALGG